MESEDDKEWSDNEEIEQAPATCPFCSTEFASASKVWEHTAASHGFDFKETRSRLGLDFYGAVKLINYIRSKSQEKLPIAKLISSIQADALFLQDEKFLKPVVQDDALLFNLEDEDSDHEGESQPPAKKKNVEDYERENLELKEKIKELQSTLSQLSQRVRDIALEEDAPKSEPPRRKTRSLRGRARWKPVEKDRKAVPKVDAYDDAGYFGSYSGRYIHELMLRDSVRTEAYRDFMYNNKDVLSGKVVLDIGCGTGILCLFAARAGAKRVIGIDKAEIIEKAREIIKANKMDHIVTLLKTKVEEAELPSDVKQVDVIISEWMGYFLLYESMLPSVLYARNKWLKPESGGVYPNRAAMYLAGFEASKHAIEKVDFWKDVYGFNMSCLIEDSDLPGNQGCLVETLDSKALITSIAELKQFDIMTVKESNLDFKSSIVLEVTRDHNLDGFVVYFDVMFDLKCSKSNILSTSPLKPSTHWKQTLFHLWPARTVKRGDKIHCELQAARRKDYARAYDVDISYSIHPKIKDGKKPEVFTQDFTIE